jgi:hypothetical protein
MRLNSGMMCLAPSAASRNIRKQPCSTDTDEQLTTTTTTTTTTTMSAALQPHLKDLARAQPSRWNDGRQRVREARDVVLLNGLASDAA